MCPTTSLKEHFLGEHLLTWFIEDSFILQTLATAYYVPEVQIRKYKDEFDLAPASSRLYKGRVCPA